MPEATIPNPGEALIEAVSNHLRGCIEILMLLRDQTKTTDAHIFAVLENALGEQIETLEDDILPLVKRGPELPLVRCVPRG